MHSILIVADTQGLVADLRTILGHRGYVVVAATADGALATLRRHPSCGAVVFDGPLVERRRFAAEVAKDESMAGLSVLAAPPKSSEPSPAHADRVGVHGFIDALGAACSVRERVRVDMDRRMLSSSEAVLCCGTRDRDRRRNRIEAVDESRVVA